MTKQCAGCERPFEAGSNRARWCPGCKAAAVKAADARYNAKRPESGAEAPGPPEGYRMSQQERRRLVAAMPGATVAELVRLTGAGTRTVNRDRAALGIANVNRVRAHGG